MRDNTKEIIKAIYDQDNNTFMNDVDNMDYNEVINIYAYMSDTIHYDIINEGDMIDNSDIAITLTKESLDDMIEHMELYELTNQKRLNECMSMAKTNDIGDFINDYSNINTPDNRLISLDDLICEFEQLEDNISEVADSNTMIYNADLLKWCLDDLSRGCFSNIDISGDTDIYSILKKVQFEENYQEISTNFYNFIEEIKALEW